MINETGSVLAFFTGRAMAGLMTYPNLPENRELLMELAFAIAVKITKEEGSR